MRIAGAVVLVLIAFIVGWAFFTVPTAHGLDALSEDVGVETAACFIASVDQEWPNRIIGPWAVESTDDDRVFRVFGSFGQEWRFRMEESVLSTSGFHGTRHFGSVSCG